MTVTTYRRLGAGRRAAARRGPIRRGPARRGPARRGLARRDPRPPADLRRLLRASLLALAATLLAIAPAQESAQETAPPSGSTVELQSRVFDITRNLRCPTCVSESVADSNAAIAIEMRNQVQNQLEQGRSEAEILAFFQERYGDWVLLEPPRRGVHLLVWWLPGIALAAGVGGLGLLMVRWTRNAARDQAQAPPDDGDLARVRAALDEEERS